MRIFKKLLSTFLPVKGKYFLIGFLYFYLFVIILLPFSGILKEIFQIDIKSFFKLLFSHDLLQANILTFKITLCTLLFNGVFGVIIAWVFVMLAIVPWLLRMDVEIKNEARGQGGQSWRTWGAPPRGKPTSRAEEYRKILRGRRKR